MRKLAPAISLTLQCIIMWHYCYYFEDTFKWAVYFHALIIFFMSLMCFMPMIVKGYAWVTFQFQILQGLYNLSLGTTFVLNYYNYVESPQWLIITSIAGAITTAMIVVSGIRHGLFKTY